MKDKQRSTSQVEDKHSPAPWKVDGTYIYEVEQDKIIAEVETYNNGELPYEANARLMAAAPELLEALNNMLDCSGRMGIRYIEASEKAEKLIAKIEGD